MSVPPEGPTPQPARVVREVTVVLVGSLWLRFRVESWDYDQGGALQLTGRLEGETKPRLVACFESAQVAGVYFNEVLAERGPWPQNEET